MLVIQNWYTDQIFIAITDEEASAVSLKNRRLRHEAGLRVVYDGVLCRHAPVALDLEVWGCLWSPDVETFLTAVGEGGERLDVWYGDILPRRVFGSAWVAHANLRQEMIGKRPCQMTLLGSGDVAKLFGISQATAHKRIKRNPRAVAHGKRVFVPHAALFEGV